MKKTVLAIFAFVSFVVIANAQTIIPKVGISLTNIKEEESDPEEGDPKAKIGLTFGAAFNFEINDVFSLQPELTFIQKGFRTETSAREDLGNGDFFAESSKDKFIINYIEVPVLGKATFGSSTKFYFTFGPSLGLGIGGKYKYDYTGSYSYQGITDSESESGSIDIKFGDEPENSEEIYIEKRVDIGLQVGAGLIIMDKINLDLRYGLGLTSLSSDVTVQNRALQFTVGIPLKLK